MPPPGARRAPYSLTDPGLRWAAQVAAAAAPQPGEQHLECGAGGAEGWAGCDAADHGVTAGGPGALPADRVDWGQAMRAELASIGPGRERREFAWGGLRAAAAQYRMLRGGGHDAQHGDQVTAAAQHPVFGGGGAQAAPREFPSFPAGPDRRELRPDGLQPLSRPCWRAAPGPPR